MKLLFSSAPFSDFFGDDAALISFYKSSNVHTTLSDYWNECLRLKTGEQKHFIFTSSHSSVDYHFHVEAVQPMDTTNETILCGTVRKNKIQSSHGVKSLTDYKKEHAEFIDLAVHDLEAPVRKLTVMFDKIQELTPRDSDANPYLGRAQRILSEMKAQGESLGVLAQLNYDVADRQVCQLTGILEKLVTAFGDAALLDVGPLPAVFGSPAFLTLLFRQLIENSIKFARQGTKPSIRISAQMADEQEIIGNHLPAGSYHKINIDDNGIGIAEGMYDRIFLPFVRLNGKSEYPGPGMGLAIARKIALQHGGNLYAEGREVGTRFILILPQTSR